VNRYYDKLGVDAIVAKNVEKRNKKRAKKGLPAEQISKNATASTKNISSADKNKDRIEKLQAMKDANDQKVKDIKESAGMTSSAKKGSLADKANMVARYNEQNKNKK
jgi:YidC/Oxa1 family membrane protein insertase